MTTLDTNERENLVNGMMELGSHLLKLSEQPRLDSAQTLRMIAGGVGQLLIGVSAILVDAEGEDSHQTPADDRQLRLFKDDPSGS